MSKERSLTAPASTPGMDEPSSAPVCLDELDLGLAKLVLERPIGVAVSVVPGIEAEEVRRLAAATIDFVVERAERGEEGGVSVSDIAKRSGVPRAVIEGPYRLLLPRYANLTGRAVNAQAPRKVFYEEVASHPARAGRRHNGVGTDKDPAGRNRLHLLCHSLGTSNCHCPVNSLPLTMGTRWDRSSPRFGQGLPKWTRRYGARLPSTFAQHLGALLSADSHVRRAYVEALLEGRGDFDDNLTAERLRGSFSADVVVPPVPYGRPEAPYRDHLDVFRPGRDAATIAVAEASGRHVVLACGEPDVETRIEFEAGAERFPVGELPSMYALDIHKRHDVEYRWSADRQELGRYQAASGVGVEIWRFVNYRAERDFWRMISLVERQVQVAWPRTCTERWEADCRPGVLGPHLPESCAAVRALLAIANFGIVDALRRKALAPGRR